MDELFAILQGSFPNFDPETVHRDHTRNYASLSNIIAQLSGVQERSVHMYMRRHRLNLPHRHLLYGQAPHYLGNAATIAITLRDWPNRNIQRLVRLLPPRFAEIAATLNGSTEAPAEAPADAPPYQIFSWEIWNQQHLNNLQGEDIALHRQRINRNFQDVIRRRANPLGNETFIFDTEYLRRIYTFLPNTVSSIDIAHHPKITLQNIGLSLESCTICLEDISAEAPIYLLHCLHNFHVACLDKWICTTNSTCPNCRELITVY